MRKIDILILFFIINSNLLAVNRIDFNFFVHPRFQTEYYDEINFSIFQATQNDSISQYNIFAGKILNRRDDDSTTVHFLNSVNCDFACPTDYYFSQIDFNPRFDIIAANISHNFHFLKSNKIINADSFRVGIFSIYTPDFTVRNDIDSAVTLDFDIQSVIQREVKSLSKQTDVIIMFSNLSKYIDKDLVKDTEIDAVISFDYQKKKNKTFWNRTEFFSLLSSDKKFGKLRLTYESGNIELEWLTKGF